MHMPGPKWDEHAQDLYIKKPKLKANFLWSRICTYSIGDRILFTVTHSHWKTKMIYACAGQNEMRMRRFKWDLHAQVEMRTLTKTWCACAGQNEMWMRWRIWDAHACTKVRWTCARLVYKRPKLKANFLWSQICTYSIGDRILFTVALFHWKCESMAFNWYKTEHICLDHKFAEILCVLIYIFTTNTTVCLFNIFHRYFIQG